MKKATILALIAVFSIGKPTRVASQDSAVLIPFLTEMIVGLGAVVSTIEDTGKQLQSIEDAMSKVEDFREFTRKAVAIREAINTLVCLSENINETQMSGLMMNLGVPTSNFLSDFMQCQYEIYYQTIDLDYESILYSIDKAFSSEEQMNLSKRLELIDKAIKKIEEIRWKTVNTKGALLEVMRRHIEVKQAEEYYSLINKI